ncbi:unnamed protein product, partial [Effrenium voratum]
SAETDRPWCPRILLRQREVVEHLRLRHRLALRGGADFGVLGDDNLREHGLLAPPHPALRALRADAARGAGGQAVAVHRLAEDDRLLHHQHHGISLLDPCALADDLLLLLRDHHPKRHRLLSPQRGVGGAPQLPGAHDVLGHRAREHAHPLSGHLWGAQLEGGLEPAAPRGRDRLRLGDLVR